MPAKAARRFARRAEARVSLVNSVGVPAATAESKFSAISGALALLNTTVGISFSSMGSHSAKPVGSICYVRLVTYRWGWVLGPVRGGLGWWRRTHARQHRRPSRLIRAWCRYVGPRLALDGGRRHSQPCSEGALLAISHRRPAPDSFGRVSLADWRAREAPVSL